MPKQKGQLTPEEQGERFMREAKKLIDAGELNPTEADNTIEQLLKSRRIERAAK